MNHNGNVESYPTWIEVDVSAIENNIKYMLDLTQQPIMLVVKANGYGMGISEVSKLALQGGVTWLGVARYVEARELRLAGITAPILVLGMVTACEVEEAIRDHVSLTLYSREMAEMVSERARQMGAKAAVHLKVDTGLGRLGVFAEDALDLAQYALKLGGIEIEGIYSHLAMAVYGDQPLTHLQIKRFNYALDALAGAGIHPRWVHLANSAAAVHHPDARYNLSRLGSNIFGMLPRVVDPYPPELRRVLTWKARLASCRVLPAGWGIGYGQTYITSSDELIGVIPVGYGDGFRRIPGNEVLIDGQRVPVVGNVCMDQSMLKLPRPYPMGTEVVIIGVQGSQSIFIDDLMKRWNTSEEDIVATLSARVPRVYVRN
ncbi:MAG: alanine racemase [Anaerolineae bacterium]|nr:alanine racemase [Anaerolineae bacterium]